MYHALFSPMWKAWLAWLAHVYQTSYKYWLGEMENFKTIINLINNALLCYRIICPIFSMLNIQMIFFPGTKSGKEVEFIPK